MKGKILEERIKQAMAKYGIRHLNQEVLEIVNDAMLKKYTDIITDLIDISRSS